MLFEKNVRYYFYLSLQNQGKLYCASVVLNSNTPHSPFEEK